MQHLDGDYVNALIARLGSIPEDAVPQWGELRRDTLMEHLVFAMRLSMGRTNGMPFVGSWFTKFVAGPLVLHGWVPIPKNVKLPRREGQPEPKTREPGDLETLHALLEEYLNLVQADELDPAPHPVFGDLGVDGWDRLHVLHFEHHLRQFSA